MQSDEFIALIVADRILSRSRILHELYQISIVCREKERKGGREGGKEGGRRKGRRRKGGNKYRRVVSSARLTFARLNAFVKLRKCFSSNARVSFASDERVRC